MKQIAIIGAGKWGQGLRFAFSQTPDTDVVITSRTPREIEGFVDLETALEREYLVMVLAAQATGTWLEAHFRSGYSGQKVLVASKGIDVATGKFLNEIYEEYVPREKLAFASGPSFAAEVSKGLPAALVVASENPELASEWMGFFPPFVKPYRSTDVRGVEIGGAYKNVIAIAAGISDGLGLGNNARAALITRGLAEMTRFGMHFGAKTETFLGLSGVGDLFLTASSTMSRNFRVGLGLAEGKSPEAILEELGEVAEGVPTARALRTLAEKEGLYTPIAAEVEAILDGKDAKESIVDLLRRNHQEEF